MGKVRYKRPSGNFEKMSSMNRDNTLRSSIGNEGSVGEYYFLSLDCLIPYKKQARKIFKEEEIQKLADTIAQYGVKTPLLVIKSSTEEEKFEVVCGERRLRAAKKVGLLKLPCIIMEDIEAEEIALIDNIQRTDLHPVELGDALSSLLEKARWGDLGELAEKIGKDHSTLSNYLSYSKLPRSVKGHLIENDIKSRDTLRSILKLETEEDMITLLQKPQNIKKVMQKSLLRINMKGSDITIQDRALYKLSAEERRRVKLELSGIIEKINKISSD